MLGWFVPYFCFEHTSLSIGSKCVERPIECCCNACSIDFPANIVVYNETKRGILRWGIYYVLYVHDMCVYVCLCEEVGANGINNDL